MKRFTILGVTALVSLMMCPCSVFALPISGAGQYGDSFIGSIDYFPASGNAGMIDGAGGSLSVTLTNTSARREFIIAGLSFAGPYLNARSEVTLGAGETARFFFPVTTDTGFSRLTTENFLAEGSEVIVHFHLRDAGGQTWDNVRVSALPEPESIVLLGIGLLALGFCLRRKTT